MGDVKRYTPEVHGPYDSGYMVDMEVDDDGDYVLHSALVEWQNTALGLGQKNATLQARIAELEEELRITDGERDKAALAHSQLQLDNEALRTAIKELAEENQKHISEYEGYLDNGVNGEPLDYTNERRYVAVRSECLWFDEKLRALLEKTK